MQTCNIRKPSPIRTNWSLVDRLMEERGIRNDAALAELVGTSASTFSRGRRAEKPTPALMLALRAAFPDVSLDELFSIPDDAEAAA
ncbi:hypothetical protein [Microbacterium sp. NPDC091662]|uniref:hypothetical protein n=1 Tax=Microbacterium sp. NPDC091662 TaxID=3364211 RepID=UPI00380C6C14